MNELDGDKPSPLQSHRESEVWQRAIELVEAIYQLSREFPSDERFGLTAQMRRAAVSVPSNIAEGYGRLQRGKYVHHLAIANGSLQEIETQLVIAGRLQYVSRQGARPTWELLQDVSKMLNKLISSLRQ
jgi:four helix bundle protein